MEKNLKLNHKQEVLLIMSYLGVCFKSDLLLYLRKYTNESRILKGMIHDGLLEIREIEKLQKRQNDKRHKNVMEIVNVTYKGKVEICNKLGNDKYLSIEKYSKRLDNISLKKLYKILIENRIIFLMASANIKALAFEKPTLYKLYYSSLDIFSNKLLNYKGKYANDARYNDCLYIEEIFKSGIYYTIGEFRELVRQDSESIDDDIANGTRAKGILITKDKIILVYISNIFENLRIRYIWSVEDRTIEIIRKYISVINGVRDISALVISNGESLVVQMGLDAKSGRKARNFKESIKTQSWLSVSDDLFNHLYVVSHNNNGINSLNYLAQNSLADWIENSKKLFKKLNGFLLIDGDKATNDIFVANDGENKAVFLPYYDVKLLWNLYAMSDDVSIVTYEDMANTISHIIRKESKIYNTNGEIINVERYRDDGTNINKDNDDDDKKYINHYRSLSFNLSYDDKKYLKSKAKEKGISISKYLRQIIKERNEI